MAEIVAIYKILVYVEDDFANAKSKKTNIMMSDSQNTHTHKTCQNIEFWESVHSLHDQFDLLSKDGSFSSLQHA